MMIPSRFTCKSCILSSVLPSTTPCIVRCPIVYRGNFTLQKFVATAEIPTVRTTVTTVSHMSGTVVNFASAVHKSIYRNPLPTTNGPPAAWEPNGKFSKYCNKNCEGTLNSVKAAVVCRVLVLCTRVNTTVIMIFTLLYQYSTVHV